MAADLRRYPAQHLGMPRVSAFPSLGRHRALLACVACSRLLVRLSQMHSGQFAPSSLCRSHRRRCVLGTRCHLVWPLHHKRGRLTMRCCQLAGRRSLGVFPLVLSALLAAELVVMPIAVEQGLHRHFHRHPLMQVDYEGHRACADALSVIDAFDVEVAYLVWRVDYRQGSHHDSLSVAWSTHKEGTTIRRSERRGAGDLIIVRHSFLSGESRRRWTHRLVHTSTPSAV